jgi:hypothetical protein
MLLRPAAVKAMHRGICTLTDNNGWQPTGRREIPRAAGHPELLGAWAAQQKRAHEADGGSELRRLDQGAPAANRDGIAEEAIADR